MGQRKTSVPHCDLRAAPPCTPNNVTCIRPTPTSQMQSRPTSIAPLKSCSPSSRPLLWTSSHTSSSSAMSIRTRARTASRTCEFCGGEFYRKEHYERHVRTHTRERPFSCSLCSSRFARRSVVHTRCFAIASSTLVIPAIHAETSKVTLCDGTRNLASLAPKI